MTTEPCPVVSRRQFLAGLGATAAVTVAGYSVGIWGRNPARQWCVEAGLIAARALVTPHGTSQFDAENVFDL